MSVVRTEEAALLRAVLGRPDDDVPRLVLADWLDEHGQPERAEFVRFGCELARQDAEDEAANRLGTNPLRGRERSLLLDHWKTWVPWADHGSSFEVILSGRWSFSGTPAVAFRRGFVAEIHLPVGQLLNHAADLFADHPITRVRPGGVRPFHAGSGRWGWSIDEADGGYDVPWVLPPEVFGYLPPPDPPFASYSPLRRWYTSEARAWEAVSVACVGYGRAINDLPPLDRWAETQPTPG